MSRDKKKQREQTKPESGAAFELADDVLEDVAGGYAGNKCMVADCPYISTNSSVYCRIHAAQVGDLQQKYMTSNPVFR